eukprot:3981921-Prymnesium_polylepis.1
MLGICADDAAAGVGGLKAWVGSLGLPRGVLHGMDRDGVPLDSAPRAPKPLGRRTVAGGGVRRAPGAPFFSLTSPACGRLRAQCASLAPSTSSTTHSRATRATQRGVRCSL